MTDIAHLDGKEFAVILVDYCKKKEGQWIVVRGVAKIKEGKLFVDRGTDVDFPIPDDTYDRIKKVEEKISAVVRGAEYVTMLTVGPPPDEKTA